MKTHNSFTDIPRNGITLLRHATTTHNEHPKRFQGRLDVPLSCKGMSDAKRLSDQFAWVRQCTTSPLSRCLQTIDGLCLSDNITKSTDPRLVEIDVGSWAGRYATEVAKNDERLYRRWLSHPETTRPGGGESLPSMQTRVLSAIDELTKQHDIDRHLIVTHGGPIRIVALGLQKRSLNDFHALHIPNLFQLEVSREAWAAARQFLDRACG